MITGIQESREGGLVVLSPMGKQPMRRVLYLNSYGGPDLWRRIRDQEVPAHHLWGCIELVELGYEVGLTEALPDFYFHRNPLPHDLQHLSVVRSWLGREGIIYCGHNTMYWLPLLRLLGVVRCPLVSLLFAREPLDLARAHAGIIALTPAAAAEARKLAPKARVAHLGWGIDSVFFPSLAYQPEWFLSNGITNRDFETLNLAASRTRRSIRIVCPGLPKGLSWPPNVQIVDGGPGWSTDAKRVTFQALLAEHCSRSAGCLVVINADPTEYTANGLTNVLEAMSLAQPLVVTRTGAMPGEIDVERAGCGLFVPPGDPDALAAAIERIAMDPAQARDMGQRGRQLVEGHYNIKRFGSELHRFFDTL
jgi:glycosyltransferase involved in cell wall biosynthesis